MKTESPISRRMYFTLVILLAALSALNVFLPQGEFAAGTADQELPASQPVLALVNALISLLVYGGLGYLGLRLALQLRLPELWDDQVSVRGRLLVPSLAGMVIGVIIIVVDVIFSQFRSVGFLPHPPFPTSLAASASAAIGEEIIFRLFFIAFWVWLIASVLLKNRWQDGIFWIIAVVSAIVFAVVHIPSVMMLYGVPEMQALPSGVLTELLLLNGLVSLVAAYYFKKVGFLGPVLLHFWVDIVWHALWGAI